MVNPPQIFKDEKELPSGVTVTDAVPSMHSELFHVRNPHVRKDSPGYASEVSTFKDSYTEKPVFVYYPWRNSAVRMLPETDYFELRTARNKHIIRAEEQNVFRSSTVAVAGLSVGSAILHALVQSGGPKRLKIADMDVVETTNLNRLRAGVPDLGTPKTDAAARMVFEIDPYAELEVFNDGITEANIERFILEPKLDLLIDEVESIEFKIRMRLLAKEHGIPVIMATDNGNGVILDVERYDREPQRPIFHGHLGDVHPDSVKNLPFSEWLALANKIVGIESMEERMKESIAELGKTIPSVPQLGASASIAGSAAAYASRTILTGNELPSGRYVFSVADMFKHPTKL